MCSKQYYEILPSIPKIYQSCGRDWGTLKNADQYFMPKNISLLNYILFGHIFFGILAQKLRKLEISFIK